MLISCLDEGRDAQETARFATESGRQAVLVPGDISEETHCKQLVRRTHEGIQAAPAEEWDCTFKTNIYAMSYPRKAAQPASVLRASSKASDITGMIHGVTGSDPMVQGRDLSRLPCCRGEEG